ncbi:MAG: hypothetical protein ABSF69_08020 [Polyangiaceae bacterium]|jgi:hypothetical protein
MANDGQSPTRAPGSPLRGGFKSSTRHGRLFLGIGGVVLASSLVARVPGKAVGGTGLAGPPFAPPAAYRQGFVVGHGTGPFPGSWQQTDTHCGLPVSVIVTVAVELSLAPLPTSVPEAAAPPFWSTPNHGSGPISKLLLAGVATIVATVLAATDAVTVASVDAEPPLIATEHQLRKFSTVTIVVPSLVAGLEVVVPAAGDP